jgi:hypothetical protein
MQIFLVGPKLKWLKMLSPKPFLKNCNYEEKVCVLRLQLFY